MEVASSDSPSRPNAFAVSVADAIFGSASPSDSGLIDPVLRSGSPDDRGKNLVASGRNMSKGDV